MELEKSRSTRGAFDHPVRLSKDSDDVIALDIAQSHRGCIGLSVRCQREDLCIDLQRRAWREDDSPLENVFKLAHGQRYRLIRSIVSCAIESIRLPVRAENFATRN